jgi:hypothetical protein
MEARAVVRGGWCPVVCAACCFKDVASRQSSPVLLAAAAKDRKGAGRPRPAGVAPLIRTGVGDVWGGARRQCAVSSGRSREPPAVCSRRRSGRGGGAGKELEVVIGGWCGGIRRLRMRIATATFVSSHWSVLAPHKRLPTVVL